jgi:hypothetical protein
MEAENAASAAAYVDLSAKLAALDPAVHMYPPHALHVTLVTLSSFKKVADAYGQALRGPEKNHYRRTWARALHTGLAHQVALGPIELVAERLELSSAAGYLVYSDRSGRMASVRQAVQLALESVMLDPIMNGLNQRSSNAVRKIKIPNIIHSTVLRFADRPTDPSQFQRDFATIAHAWKPVPVLINVLALVEEIVPFMHGVNAPELVVKLSKD